MADAVVVLFIVVPAVLTYFLKSNGGVVFLSVCAGYVMASLSGNELSSTLSTTSFKIRNTDIDLLFMFLPMAFSIFFTAWWVSGKTKIIMHALASALAGALFVTAAAPFLGISLHLNLEDSTLWAPLRSAESYIVGLGSLYSLILIWFFSKHSTKKHH